MGTGKHCGKHQSESAGKGKADGARQKEKEKRKTAERVSQTESFHEDGKTLRQLRGKLRSECGE
jgi:hypothetical protein